jgi:hypothetical protein
MYEEQFQTQVDVKAATTAGMKILRRKTNIAMLCLKE